MVSWWTGQTASLSARIPPAAHPGSATSACSRRYRLFGTHSAAGSTLIAGVLGIRLPSGNTHQHNDQGEYLDSHLQLGTGSTDALLGLSFDHAMDGHRCPRTYFSRSPVTAKPAIAAPVGDSVNYE